MAQPTDPALTLVLELPRGKILLTHLTYHTLEAAGVSARAIVVVVKAASREEYMERVRREYGEVVDRVEMEEQEWIKRCSDDRVKQKMKEKQDMKSEGKAEKKKKEESRLEKQKEAMLAKLKMKKAKLEKDKAVESEKKEVKEALYDVDKVLQDIEGHGKDDVKTKKSKKKREDPVLAGEEDIRSIRARAKGSSREKKKESGKFKEKKSEEVQRKSEAREGSTKLSLKQDRKNPDNARENSNGGTSADVECKKSRKVEVEEQGREVEVEEQGREVEVEEQGRKVEVEEEGREVEVEEVAAPEASLPTRGVIPISSSTSRSLLGGRREVGRGGGRQEPGRGWQAAPGVQRAARRAASSSTKGGTGSRESKLSQRGPRSSPRAAGALPSLMDIPGLAAPVRPGTRPGKVEVQEGGRRERVRAADRKGVEKATQEGREVEEALWRSEVTAQAEATRRARLERQQEYVDFRHLQVGGVP